MVTFKFTVPSTISDGSYYLLALINAGEAIQESNYTNNTAVASSTTTITQPIPADLTGSIDYAPSALLLGEKRNPLVLTIENAGGTRFKGSFPINLYASASDSYDVSSILIASLSVNLNLVGGGEKVLTVQVGSPSNVPTGNYYIVAFFNQGQSVVESNYSNDTAVAPATTSITQPYIDPAGSFFSFPATLYEGTHTFAFIAVTNNGNVPAVGLLTATVLLSPDNSSGTGAASMGTLSKEVNLRVGETDYLRVNLFAPESAIGIYLEGLINFSGALSDDNLGNNIFFSNTAVTLD